jgi:DNA-binding PadR family transcriptional regulator
MADLRTSEIEACVLALAWDEGPLTPYAIRKVFLNSPSPQWSGSAGTIYPLVNRLLRRGWIRSEVRFRGKRKGNQISLTAAGLRVLRRWLAVPLQDWVAGVPPDPLRTRVRFLGALPLDQRRQFIRRAHRQTQEHLRLVEEDCKLRRSTGNFQYLMARGALLSMRARCAFVREVAKALGLSTRKHTRAVRAGEGS